MTQLVGARNPFNIRDRAATFQDDREDPAEATPNPHRENGAWDCIWSLFDKPDERRPMRKRAA